MKYDHIYSLLPLLQVSACPLKSPLIIMAFCLFMMALLDPVSTVHMCMCMGPSIGK